MSEKCWLTRLVFIVILSMFLTGTKNALADRRSYVWTYEYLTVPKGESEIEYYLTHKVPDSHKYDKKNIWEHAIEYEFGITDRLDFSVYQTFKQTTTNNEDEFDYTGSKFRTRFRFGEKGSSLIDTLLYLEYILPDDSTSPDKVEAKLILAKDFGKWNIAYNQIVEKGIDNGGTTEHAYAAGLGYEFSPAWKMALESKGNYTEDKYYLGPTVSWATEKFWVNLGALRGLNDRSDDYMVRLIIGFPF